MMIKYDFAGTCLGLTLSWGTTGISACLNSSIFGHNNDA